MGDVAHLFIIMKKLLLILFLFLITISTYGQKYNFELNENFDVENKEFFHKIQLEFNNFLEPFKYTLVYDEKQFYINSQINVRQEEFEIFLNKHGYSLKKFEKIE